MTMMIADSTLDRGHLRESVRTTLTRLSRTGELPALPETAAHALAVARNPEADTDDLCRVIRSDVGLSARILRAANSAAYARRTAAKTLQEAVLTVGLRKTCDLLVAASARQLYRVASPHANGLWEHALAVAVAAEEIARVTRRVPPATAFLPGLFHDVGRIAFLLADADAFDVIREIAQRGEHDANDLERGWYEFDHAEAGAILVEEWGLAPEQCDAIRWHHRPQQADGGRTLAGLVEVADGVAAGIGYGTNPVGGRSLRDALGLSEADEAALRGRVAAAFAAQHDVLS